MYGKPSCQVTLVTILQTSVLDKKIIIVQEYRKLPIILSIPENTSTDIPFNKPL